MGFLDQDAFDAAAAVDVRVTALEAAPPGGGTAISYLSADQAFSTTSLADVVGLSFPVVANTNYRFEFDVIFRSAATTTGLGLGLTFPAVTGFACRVGIPIASGAGGEFQGYITASGGSVVGTAVAAANVDYLATVKGTIRPSANGTVQLRARSEIAASAVTVRAGSLVAV